MAAVPLQASRALCAIRAFTPNKIYTVESGAAPALSQARPASLGAAAQPRRTPVPAPRAASLDCVFDETEIPTPDVPSTTMMADFLVTYGRTLKHFAASGDNAAAAGSNVLERVRAGVMFLLGTSHSTEWAQREKELEVCLVELQKDLDLIQRYHDSRPNKTAVQMASLRCIEAARLLQQL